jgi:predicted dehydrogenase
MKTLKVGVIGLGRMGKNHCRVFSAMWGVELAAVYDLNPEIGQPIAQQFQTHSCQSLEELFGLVDAVSIVTPTSTHYEMAMRCLDAGLHVCLEKPMTETISQAENLCHFAYEQKCILQVGHIERFNPTYVELKHVMEKMTVLAVNFRRLSPYAGSNTDVDVVLDLMTHDLDLVLNMAGSLPKSVTTTGLSAFHKAVDHAVVNMCFAGGPLVTMTASRLTEQKVRQIEVTALEAYIEANLLSKTLQVHHSTTGEYVNYKPGEVKYRQESVVEFIHVPGGEPLYLELQDFVDCVRHGREPQVTAADGLAALRLATQIQESIHAQLEDVLVIG